MKTLDKNEAITIVLLTFILSSFISYFVTNFSHQTSTQNVTTALPPNGATVVPQQGGSPVPDNVASTATSTVTSTKVCGSCCTGARSARTLC